MYVCTMYAYVLDMITCILNIIYKIINYNIILCMYTQYEYICVHMYHTK